MPEDTPLDDILTEIAERAAEQVAQGFDTPAEIIELVTEIIEEEYSVAKLPDLVTQAVDRALQAHFTAQDGWDGKTDCDRLDEAFAALDRAGICARQHWTWCQTCGHAEIGDAFPELEAQGITPRGYAFYHQQDTESAVEGDGIYLAYGALEEGEAPCAAVGREIVGALEAAGLTVEWDGSTNSRIVISPIEWRRRRPDDQRPG